MRIRIFPSAYGLVSPLLQARNTLTFGFTYP